MILFGLFLNIEYSVGFDCVMYYNGYVIVEINGVVVLGYFFD